MFTVDYWMDLILCAGASILVFLVPAIIFLTIDFIIYCITGKCLLHKFYRFMYNSAKNYNKNLF